MLDSRGCCLGQELHSCLAAFRDVALALWMRSFLSLRGSGVSVATPDMFLDGRFRALRGCSVFAVKVIAFLDVAAAWP